MMNRLSDCGPSVEVCVREVLVSHELLPGTERYLQWVAQQPSLSQRDRDLLALLHDALNDGCIRRVGQAN